MKKDGKKVLILGNGFDLNLGRRTSYRDFYNSEFCPKDYPAPLIKHLNDKWAKNLAAVRWYDLENELSNYYFGIKNNDYNDIISKKEKVFIDKFRNQKYLFSLIRYNNDDKAILYNLIDRKLLSANNDLEPIRLVNKDLLLDSIERDKVALELIKKGLMKYLIKVQDVPIDKNTIASIVARTFIYEGINNTHIIYSFNYTRFDALTTNSSFTMKFNNIIKYVHGCCLDGNIILGTKDDKITSDYDFIQKSFDSHYNPPAMVYDLMDADDITIFGHSLGVNDSQYFKAFFEKQSSSVNPKKKNITVFTKDTKSEMEIKRSLQEMTNWNLTSLYGLNHLEIIKTDECKGNPLSLKNYIKRFIKNEDEIDKIINNTTKSISESIN